MKEQANDRIRALLDHPLTEDEGVLYIDTICYFPEGCRKKFKAVCSLSDAAVSMEAGADHAILCMENDYSGRGEFLYCCPIGKLELFNHLNISYTYGRRKGKIKIPLLFSLSREEPCISLRILLTFGKKEPAVCIKCNELWKRPSSYYSDEKEHLRSYGEYGQSEHVVRLYFSGEKSFLTTRPVVTLYPFPL